MKLAKRIETLTPSATLAITAKARKLRSQGIDVIDFGVGEPDFNTPENIIEASYKAMKAGFTKYTASGGVPELKDAIIDKLKRDQDLTYTQEEVMVGLGAKHVLYLIFQALLDEGDEVIIPAPYWVSYPEQVKLAGGTPIIIEASEESSFKITADQVAKAITPQTKAIILNSPNNPSGMIYQKDELSAIGEVCLQHGLLIISDEIYEKLIYDDNEFCSIAQLSPALKQQTLVVNGFSKSHAMTGWRLGYIAGNQILIKALENLASQSTSNPTTPSQYGAIEAYNGPQESVQLMRDAFEKRLEAAYQMLLEIPKLTCVKSQGAFYLLANALETAKLCGYQNVDQFAEALLEEAHVAVVPGKGFGVPDHIRLSYATSQENLIEGFRRMKQFVEQKLTAKV